MTLPHIVFWLAVAACLVAQIGIVRASVAPARAHPEGARVPRPARGAELVWVVLPALLLVLALLWTWRAIEHAPRATHAPHLHSSTLDAPAAAGRGGST